MNVKKKSQKQEKQVAKEIKGKTTIASGALYFQKADVRNDEFLVECKTTAKFYYSLKIDTWERINKQAIKDGMRIPVMCIDLEDGKNRMAVFSEPDFVFKDSYYLFAEVEQNEVLTPAKSYRINSTPMVLSFNSMSYALCIAPWDVFLEMTEKENYATI